MNVNSGAINQLADDGARLNSWVAWSPDDSKIALGAFLDHQNFEIGAMDPSGNDVTNYTDRGSCDGNLDLYIMDSNGNNRTG